MSIPDQDGSPLEELAFLARSPNRVEVLEALTRGPWERRDLELETGVARATLARILDDFVERGWAVEADRAYETTQLGGYVSREVASLLDRFAAVPALNAVAPWFPEDGFPFDLGRLADATVVRSTKRDALAPTTHIERRIRAAERVRLLTYAVLPGVLDACWSGISDADLRLEAVLDAGAVEGVSTEPELLERASDLFETDRAEVYVAESPVDSTLFVVDGSVLLCLSGGEGAPLAVIETDDSVVGAWADARIDDHRRRADRLDASPSTD